MVVKVDVQNEATIHPNEDQKIKVMKKLVSKRTSMNWKPSADFIIVISIFSRPIFTKNHASTRYFLFRIRFGRQKSGKKYDFNH